MPTLPFLSVFCMLLLKAKLFSKLLRSTSCPLCIHGASYSVPAWRIWGFPLCSLCPHSGEIWILGSCYSLWNDILFAQDFVVGLCFPSCSTESIFWESCPHFSEQSWHLEVALPLPSLLIPEPLGKCQCWVVSSLSGWKAASFKCKFPPEQPDLSLPGAIIWTLASKCV